MATATNAAKTSAKFTAAKVLLTGIKAKHSVLTRDADTLYQFLAEQGYAWNVRGSAWVNRRKR